MLQSPRLCVRVGWPAIGDLPFIGGAGDTEKTKFSSALLYVEKGIEQEARPLQHRQSRAVVPKLAIWVSNAVPPHRRPPGPTLAESGVVSLVRSKIPHLLSVV